MNICILAFGTWGDVRPNVLLGKHLQEAGHHVTILASSNFADWVQQNNLNFYPLKTNIQEIIDELTSNSINLFRALYVIRKLITPAMEQLGLDVMDACANADVLLTHESGLSVVSGIAEQLNLKVILINLQPLSETRTYASIAIGKTPSWMPMKTRYNLLTHRLIQRSQWHLLGSKGNKLRKEHLNMPPMRWKGYLQLLKQTPTLTCVSPLVVPRPTDWSENQHMTGFMIDTEHEWQAPDVLTTFIHQGSKPVYIGFGSMGDQKPEQTMQVITEAVQQAQVRAIILSGWAKLNLQNVSDSIYVLDYAPHYWLFPKMAGIIHHGGAGTTASALYAGVPQTIVPHTADQPFWGNRIHELGLGTAPIPRNRLNVSRLANALHQLSTSPDLSRNAQDFAQQIGKENGIQNAIELIERLITK